MWQYKKRIRAQDQVGFIPGVHFGGARKMVWLDSVIWGSKMRSDK